MYQKPQRCFETIKRSNGHGQSSGQQQLRRVVVLAGENSSYGADPGAAHCWVVVLMHSRVVTFLNCCIDKIKRCKTTKDVLAPAEEEQLPQRRPQHQTL